MHPLTRDPSVHRVREAVAVAHRTMDAIDRAAGRTRSHNGHGGDVGIYRNHASVLRHCVNYVVGAGLAADVVVPGPVVDVGSGTGSFSELLRMRLDRALHLVEIDVSHACLAAEAFPRTPVHTDLADAPAAAVVTAMEVIEHVPGPAQEAFVRSLADQVEPGGCLVLSTPDESGYLGGWSGYAPHVGPLDAAGLAEVLSAGTGGWPVEVVRIDGPGFRLGRVAAVLQPVGNRLWTAVQTASRGRAEAVAAHGARALPWTRRSPQVPTDGCWHLVDALDPGAPALGNGLVAVARRPLPSGDQGGPGSGDAGDIGAADGGDLLVRRSRDWPLDLV